MVGEDKINPTVIVPSVFDSRVAPAVAAAVRAAAHNPSPLPAADPGPADLPEIAAERQRNPVKRKRPTAHRPTPLIKRFASGTGRHLTQTS